jgi:hypothetical protein
VPTTYPCRKASEVRAASTPQNRLTGQYLRRKKVRSQTGMEALQPLGVSPRFVAALLRFLVRLDPNREGPLTDGTPILGPHGSRENSRPVGTARP